MSMSRVRVQIPKDEYEYEYKYELQFIFLWIIIHLFMSTTAKMHYLELVQLPRIWRNLWTEKFAGTRSQICRSTWTCTWESVSRCRHRIFLRLAVTMARGRPKKAPRLSIGGGGSLPSMASISGFEKLLKKPLEVMSNEAGQDSRCAPSPTLT